MKKINKDSITNIENTNLFDNTFSLDYLSSISSTDIKIIYIRDLLEDYKNEEILKRVKEKPAMWSNVYSPKDELEIFIRLFEEAIEKKEKIHIV